MTILVIVIAFSIYYNFKLDNSYKITYFKQENDNYCGEASIQMVLDYYRVNPLPSQDDIAKEVNYRNNLTYVSEMPIPFSNRNIMYEIYQNTDFNLAYNNLINNISQAPSIILITWSNGKGHYWVVYNANVTGIFYHDPLYGSSLYASKEKLYILWHENCLNYPPQSICWALLFKK